MKPTEKGVLARFYRDPALGDAEMISIHVAGTRFPVERKALDKDRIRFKSEYESFQKGLEMIDGTPLDHMPGMNPHRVADCNYHGVFTVEQLAEVSDLAIQKMTPDSRQFRRAAQKMLEDREKHGGKEALEEMDGRLKRAEAQLDDHAQQIVNLTFAVEDAAKAIASLEEKLNDVADNSTKRRRRGRPPKAKPDSVGDKSGAEADPASDQPRRLLSEEASSVEHIDDVRRQHDNVVDRNSELQPAE